MTGTEFSAGPSCLGEYEKFITAATVRGGRGPGAPMLEPDYERLWMHLKLSRVDSSLNAMGSQNDMINKI